MTYPVGRRPTSLADARHFAEQRGPASQELEQLQQWLRHIKADDPGTARLLVRECATAGPFLSNDGKLTILLCMKRKYDEGVRAE